MCLLAVGKSLLARALPFVAAILVMMTAGGNENPTCELSSFFSYA